jgi:hypothetical protein
MSIDDSALKELENVRGRGPISATWGMEREVKVLCDLCMIDLHADVNFPLFRGLCSHTICNCCYVGLVKDMEEGSSFRPCPVDSEGCGPRSFPVNPPMENHTAMMAVASLENSRAIAETEMQFSHQNWSSESRLLQGKVSNLQKAVASLTKQLEMEKKRLPVNMKTKKDAMLRSAQLARDTRSVTKHLQLQLGWEEQLYLICPNCHTHVETLPKSKLLGHVSLKFGWNIVDDSKYVHDLTSRAMLRAEIGFGRMRHHLRKQCLCLDAKQGCRECDLPPFYAQEGIIGGKRQREEVKKQAP